MTGPIPARLLVVDDMPANRELLERRLRRFGHEVAVAEGGRQALGMLAKQDFDLVLLDITMPEVDGYGCSSRFVRTRRCGTCRS